ncbi:MAG TPA: hypothetical protein VGD37_11180 [Kofleriaceae bacterium]|jgi:hypothetical protein
MPRPASLRRWTTCAVISATLCVDLPRADRPARDRRWDEMPAPTAPAAPPVLAAPHAARSPHRERSHPLFGL